MTDREMEKRLAQALSRAAPDDPEGVLSRCETRKGTVIPMTDKKTLHRRLLRNLTAACLALLLLGGGWAWYQQSWAVASVISLDVNPSIELKVNQKETVLSCTPLNADAETVLADLNGGADLKGTRLTVAANAIVGALVRSGYLDSISSAILISVEDRNQDRAGKLRQELTAAVDAVLQGAASQASVLSQTLAQDAELNRQARENQISTGKAALVKQAMALNSRLQFEALSALSVEELKDLVETGAPGMPIGKEAARLAALAYAGVTESSGVCSEVDAELDDTPAHYEVELSGGFGEYEYKVDAYSGSILSGTAPISAAPGGQTAQSAGGALIGEAAAKSAALAHAGVKEADAQVYKLQLDYDDGRPEQYEVAFRAGGVRYEYDVEPYSGRILSYERKTEQSAVPASGEAGDIGEAAAKSAALAHAGVKEAQVSGLQVQRDYDDGQLVYEVEFRAGGLEYEYTIQGSTGAVLEHETDRKD